MESSRLKDKVAIITGSSRGIGREIALKLASSGVKVALFAKTLNPTDKIPGSLMEVKSTIDSAGGTSLALQVDVRDEEQIQKAVARVVEEFGRIDIVVNNAGIVHLAPTDKTSSKRLDLMLSINLRAVFLLVQHCLPHLAKSDHAHILNISPPIGMEAKWLAPHLAYTLSKFGMSMCTLGWAAEFRRQSIAANSLWPKTLIDTAAMNLFEGVDVDKDCRRPSIVADAAFWMLSQSPKELTGQNLLDEEVLRRSGVEDFSPYQSEGAEPKLDLYVEGFTPPKA